MAVKASVINGILNIASIAIMLIILLGAITQYMAPHFGWRIDGIRSGSMSPEMERGALVIGRPVKPADITVGDIIIFRPLDITENLVAHRVIKVDNRSPIWFTTKGDANPTPDPVPVPARNVEDKVVFHVPLLGFAAIFLDTPVGFAAAVAVPGVTLVLMLLMSLSSELKKRKGSADE